MRRSQSGMTLLELMITLVVASLLAVATFKFFAGQQQIYDVQSKLQTVQQNLWASMDTVARYVRSAGTGMLGCVRDDSDGSGPDTGDPPPGSATAPQTGLRIYRNGIGVSRVAPLWIQNGAAGAPDSLTVAFGSNTSGTFSDATLGANVALPTDPFTTLTGQTVRFLTGEMALLVDKGPANGDHGCTMFQVTGTVVSSATLQHDGTASTWNPAVAVAGYIPFTYNGGTATTVTGGIREFGQLTWVQFAIDSTGAPTVAPRLTMNRLDGSAGPVVLADGIEDMQIAYACDLQPAGAPDGVLSEGTDTPTKLADEWTYNVAADVPPAACLHPDAVRVTLIARSLTEDLTLSQVPGNAKPAAEDGVAGAVDRYRHRVATVSIYPRN